MSVFSIFTAYPWAWCLLVSYMLACFLYTRTCKRSKLELFFKQGSPMAKIVGDSTLTTHEYVPYFLAWIVHLQGAFFMPYTTFHENFLKATYFREIFTFSDGEKIAIDWYSEAPESK